jgi:hypothetical protein
MIAPVIATRGELTATPAAAIKKPMKPMANNV